MTVMIKVAVFILGMYLSIRLMAALYGILDFWYTIRTAYPKVIRGILVWALITVAVGLVLKSPYRSPYLWGLLAFLIFNVCSIWINKIVAAQAMGSQRTKGLL